MRLASSSRAFKYFSTHCWQWNPMLLAAVFVRRRISEHATSKSSSAQRTHSRVACFIHHFSLPQDASREAILAPHSARLPNQQVHGKRGFGAATNLDHLVGRASLEGHDNDEINVRFRR